MVADRSTTLRDPLRLLGVSDVSPWIAFAVVAGIRLALLAWSQWLFTSGRKLKP